MITMAKIAVLKDASMIVEMFLVKNHWANVYKTTPLLTVDVSKKTKEEAMIVLKFSASMIVVATENAQRKVFASAMKHGTEKTVVFKLCLFFLQRKKKEGMKRKNELKLIIKIL